MNKVYLPERQVDFYTNQPTNEVPMIILNLKRDPYWIELPRKVRLYVRPPTTAIMSAAQNATISEIGALKAAASSGEKTNYAGIAEGLLLKALARYAVIKWEGVFEPGSNEVAPITDKNINDLMDIWIIAEDFWAQYASPLAILEKEGKSSGLAPSGTTAAGQNIAVDAKRKGSRAVKAKKIR